MVHGGVRRPLGDVQEHGAERGQVGMNVGEKDVAHQGLTPGEVAGGTSPGK